MTSLNILEINGNNALVYNLIKEFHYSFNNGITLDIFS